jgi:diguanylate cyclase (GGDEF)-like protein
MQRLSYIRRQVARAVTLTSVLLGAVMIAMLWTGIVWKHRNQVAQDYSDAVKNSENLTLLFEENVVRSIGQMDQALTHLRRLIGEQGFASDLHQLLTSPPFVSEIVTQFSIIDADGVLRATSLNDRPAPLDLSDRQHYRFHMGRTTDDLYISGPVVGRGSGRWLVPLTRRLVNADGAFAGIVLAAFKPEYFARFYKTVNLGPSGTISLIGLDGQVRAASGADGIGRFRIGQDLTDTRLLKEVLTNLAGTFLEPAAGSEPARIVTYRRLRDQPLAVTMSIARDEIYAAAHSDALRHSIVGAILTIMILIVSVRGARSQLRVRLATAQAHRSELRARQKSEQLRLTLDNMSQGIFLVTKDNRIPVINRQAARLLDLPDEFLHAPPKYSEMVRYQEARGEYSSLPLAAGMTPLQYLVRRDPGGTYPTFERTRPNGVVLEVRTVPLPDGGFVRTLTDITHRRQAQEAAVRLASEDALTGLVNRQQFKEELAKCALRQQPSPSSFEQEEDGGFALLCLDLDWFKIVNETLGHWIGDGLLQAVAERLKTTVRANHVVARLGGDEFAVLLPRTRSTEQPETLAKRLAEALTAPYEVHGQHVRIGISIGIALAPHDGNDPELLLKAGEMALYAAKAAGRGTYRFFHKSMAEQLRVRRQLELDLRSAIDNDELALHYQPLINIADRTISGFEALMRWEHPFRGPVPPSEFIPIAEETGLITALGAWAIRKACEQAAGWPAGLRVAVNVSPMQFRSSNLVATVSEILRETGLGPDRLELEITETILMQESDSTVLTLHQLRDLGVRISMDDFGTGYSSLSYLRSFPLSKIKIDRAFVKDLGASEASDIIIRSVIDIAKTLKMATTAEGVETKDQLECLAELGCTEAQGYLLSRPVPVARVPDIIAQFSTPKPIAA